MASSAHAVASVIIHLLVLLALRSAYLTYEPLVRHADKMHRRVCFLGSSIGSGSSASTSLGSLCFSGAGASLMALSLLGGSYSCFDSTTSSFKEGSIGFSSDFTDGSLTS